VGDAHFSLLTISVDDFEYPDSNIILGGMQDFEIIINCYPEEPIDEVCILRIESRV